MPTSLRTLSRWLRKHYPIKRRLTIRVYDSPRMVRLCGHVHGFAHIEEKRAVVRIALAPIALMEETLLEEYAHLVRHETPVPVTKEHDSIFWAILGQITMHYRGGDD